MSPVIVVASTNPVKIECTRQGFSRMFPHQTPDVTGVAVASGVSDQPFSRDETITGATNRAREAARLYPQADYLVGIEGGVEPRGDLLEVFAWVVIQHRGKTGSAQTGIFHLPKEVADLVHQGYELGDADDLVFERSGSKQANGSIGLLTDDIMTRVDFYVPAVMMALIPFKKPHLTWHTG